MSSTRRLVLVPPLSTRKNCLGQGVWRGGGQVRKTVTLKPSSRLPRSVKPVTAMVAPVPGRSRIAGPGCRCQRFSALLEDSESNIPRQVGWVQPRSPCAVCSRTPLGYGSMVIAVIRPQGTAHLAADPMVNTRQFEAGTNGADTGKSL